MVKINKNVKSKVIWGNQDKSLDWEVAEIT